MKPAEPTKPHPDPISQVDAKREAVAHGLPVDHRDATPAELDAASKLGHPVLTESRADQLRREVLLKRDPSTLTQHERDWLAGSASPDADALAARERVRAAVLHVDDANRINLIHQVDGRTTTIARELEGDAAVLEQLAAQMRLDARDLRAATTAQTQTLDITVARMRAFAAQLVMLCASRDVPLPQIPTLPAPPHVPPPRA